MRLAIEDPIVSGAFVEMLSPSHGDSAIHSLSLVWSKHISWNSDDVVIFQSGRRPSIWP